MGGERAKRIRPDPHGFVTNARELSPVLFEIDDLLVGGVLEDGHGFVRPVIGIVQPLRELLDRNVESLR
jgi:hypothetical protein